MPTNCPRIQVTLDDETNGLLAMLADKQKQSLSSAAATLIRSALETHEDIYLADISNQRIAADDGTRISHEDAWDE